MTVMPQNKQIKLVRLRTLRMSRGPLSGDHASQRASSTGFEFDSLRVYEQGDDVRRIDWNSSVRVGSLMVRSFREQHNRTIILMLDVSRSMYSGSHEDLKCHLMEVVAHSIGFAAEASRDAVGVCLTKNEHIVDYIAPRTGREHSMHCREVIDKALAGLSGKPNYTSEDYKASDLSSKFPHHAWIILITDGLVQQYETWWRSLSLRNFLTIVRVRDRYEKHIPTGFSISCYDPEQPQPSGRRMLGTSLQDQLTAWYGAQFSYAQKLGLPLVDIIAGEPYEYIIRSFFEQGR